MKIQEARVEELYRLHERRSEYMKQSMDAMAEEGIDSPTADKAYKKTLEFEKKIEDKLCDIDRETDVVTGTFVGKLVEAVFPKSLSRVLKCLEVCGVEVVR